MASGPTTFAICSVFSPERHKGNPLAVVSVRGNALSPQRKSLIAKEFGYSETIFIHDSPGQGIPRRVEIFTERGEEIPFAGHPIIGVTHYIFGFCERLASVNGRPVENDRQSTVLMTKAGPVPVFYNPYRMVAACAVPHNLHLHTDRVNMSKILACQPQIQIVPAYDYIKDKTFPVVSGVKGMTFALIDLTDAPEIFAALKPSEAPEYELDAEWGPSFTGAFYYKQLNPMTQDNEPTINAIQARMITQGIEDPGTGSACSALASYLATGGLTSISPKVQTNDADSELSEKTEQVKLDDKDEKEKLERHVYAIQQGFEMGRPCTVAVEVDLRVEEDGSKSIVNVTLSGRANFFATGELLPY